MQNETALVRYRLIIKRLISSELWTEFEPRMSELVIMEATCFVSFIVRGYMFFKGFPWKKSSPRLDSNGKQAWSYSRQERMEEWTSGWSLQKKRHSKAAKVIPSSIVNEKCIEQDFKLRFGIRQAKVNIFQSQEITMTSSTSAKQANFLMACATN